MNIARLSSTTILLLAGAAWAGGDPFNAELAGHWDGFSGSYADVWGDGEFAYVGHFGDAAVHIVDISDPSSPQAIEYELPPPNTGASAQDVKVAQGLLFISLEGNSDASVHIVDVRDPLDPRPLVDVAVPGFAFIHNVFYADGFLYMADSGTPRVAIIDLRDLDPDDPPPGPITTPRWIVENVGTSMVHDMTVAGGRLYAAAWDSGLWVYDVTDVATTLPAFLGSAPGNNTHSCWPTANRDFVVTGEERTGGGIQVYRIIDQGAALQLQLTDALSLPQSEAISVHNQVIDGYRLYNSWYQAGLQVFDIIPETGTLELVASFDTFPGSVGGFNGAWGVYPFLGPDRVLVSDLSSGLYVIAVGGLSFNYPDGRPQLLDPLGDSIRVQIKEELGQLLAGTATLHYDDGSGFTSVDLVPLEGEHLFDAVFPALPCGSLVRYYFSAQSDNGVVWEDPPGAPSVVFEAQAASETSMAFTDDFEADLGWSVQSSPGLTTGAWERGVPAGSGERGDPVADADGSGRCFLTDNSAGDSDVDFGSTTLLSPVLDASSAGVAFVSYARWFTNDEGQNPGEDTLVVEISNDDGQSWQVLEVVSQSSGVWVQRSYRIDAILPPTSQMRVRFTAEDSGGPSIVEAGVDGFEIEVYLCPLSPADVNEDGVVDVQDLVEVITSWGPCPPDPAPCPADVDGDGSVGVTDLIEVVTNWT